MIEYIYIPLILILYARQWKFQLKIDDPVKRDGYLYEGPQKVKPEFYKQTQPLMATITNIGVYMAVCGYIHYLFGWKVALLYALIPTNIGSVAWVTGNYYASTTLLVLAATMFLTFTSTMPLIWAEIGQGSTIAINIVLAGCFYAAALNSTVNALSFVLIAPFLSPYGWTMVIPFIFFLTGKRFRFGMKLRKESHANIGVASKFNWKHVTNSPKIIAGYLWYHLFPVGLGFFYGWTTRKRYDSKIFLLFASIFCLEWWYIGLKIDPVMIWWYFASLAIFCHIQGKFGQYFTVERYSCLATIPFCIIINKLIPNDIIFTIMCTTYFWLTHEYVKAWRNNETLFSYSMETNYSTSENANNYGSLLLNEGKFSQAAAVLQVALLLSDIESDRFRVYLNLARCYAHETVMRLSDALKMITLALASPSCPADGRDSLIKMRDDIWKKMEIIQFNRKKLKRLGITN